MAKTHFSSSDDIFEFLMGFVNVEKGQKTEFKLDRMLYLASLLGNPHMGRKTIHVAGSKGKGSVSAMCANILARAGFGTGLYTSPHLLRWKERISFADKEMPEKTLITAMEEILPLIEEKNPSDFPGGELPTYFELTTLVAFCAFRRSGCTAQVIETGLGGRLDSTNIVDPDVSVITPIELEHTQYLGDTIEKIAGEKAGIIKEHKPVCIAVQKSEAFRVFRSAADLRHSPFFSIEEAAEISDIRIGADGTDCTIRATSARSSPLSRALPEQGLSVHSPMIGRIQAYNMALAIMATSCAVPDLAPQAVAEGLAAARLPARFELVCKDPSIVLDGAHTPESITLTMDTMASLYGGEKVLLFACAYDKKHEEMARILAPHFGAIVVTKPGTFKQSSPEAVFESFKAIKSDAELIPDTHAAIVRATSLASARNAALLVTGSFYLCAEAKTILASRGV